MKRCAWAENSDDLYKQYHDEEWGRPIYDDQKLFEFLVLESAQAGLSWKTILNKREGYRKAFKNFKPVKVADMTQVDVDKLLQNSNIIRNRLKITSTISNAQAFRKIQKEFNSFSDYLWSFVDHKQIKNHWSNGEEVPTQTALSIEISQDLKKRGLKFFGPTICYAYLQAIGIVNDHTVDCFCYSTINKI